jgi:hypothetical protein
VEEQFNAFMDGFHELIPADLITVFDERELELLIGGIADIDVDDWKKHTDYRGYQESDEVIGFFWKVRHECRLSFEEFFSVFFLCSCGCLRRDLGTVHTQLGL